LAQVHLFSATSISVVRPQRPAKWAREEKVREKAVVSGLR